MQCGLLTAAAGCDCGIEVTVPPQSTCYAHHASAAAGERVIQWPSPASPKPRIPVPAELIIVIATTLVSYLGHFQTRYSLKVAGVIPAGACAIDVSSVLGYHT